MRVLIIKTSSLGDVIHTLPALMDAVKQVPNIQFDWVVEESFQEIPAWHSRVNKVIPIALRRWRKDWFSALKSGEMSAFLHSLRMSSYDYIIDAQGLLKSGVIALLAKGKRGGFSWAAAKEPLTSLIYHDKTYASWKEHAILRARALFAGSLKYELPIDKPNYGLDLGRVKKDSTEEIPCPYLIFLHGTTWKNKHWPEAYWVELARKVVTLGFQIRLFWGNPQERERAVRIAQAVGGVIVMPKLNLKEIAKTLAFAKAVVAVDTGLGHLTAALGIPCLSLYGPSDVVHSGTMGDQQFHLTVDYSCSPCRSRQCTHRDAKKMAAPCFSSLPPDKVWAQLRLILSRE